MQPVKTKKKLSRADKKQIEAAIARANRTDKKGKSAQDSIPYERMWPDGICRVSDNHYTKTIQFQDINYQLSQNEDKTAIFEGWCDFLNYFDSSIHFQLSFLNLAASEETFANSISIPPQRDAFDSIREEYTTMLQNQLARGNNGLIKTKYLTFGIDADSIKAAKPRLERIETDILNNFKRLGVAARTLDGKERLSQLHAVFHMDEQLPFQFEWDWLAPSGLSTKDFIAPSSFEFRTGKQFRMGKKYGAVSFLQILAPELNDRLLADFLDMESSLIVSMHIQSVDQVKAIKTVKRKITDLDRSKIEEQKKAVRAGYDMDIIPSDLATYGSEAKKLLQDLQSRNERMFLLTFLVLNTADNPRQLGNNIFQAGSIAQKYNCQLTRLDFQQEEGLMSCLPLGLNQIEIQRGLTTSSTAIFVPFTTQELFQNGKEALYYGINALSNNLIMVDRKHKGFIKGFESDLEVLTAHPHPEDGFAGMEIRGDLLTDKENAGAALLDACKEVKTSDPVQIGNYRGYAMSVEFSAWKQEYTLLLKGQMTHRAILGTDPRGNLTRIDNALAQMPQRLEAAKAQLDHLYQQQAAAKEEVGKPFLYEEELRSKNARLVELDTLLNIDGKGQAHAEAVVAKSTRTSVLDSLKRPVTPRSTDKKPKQHEEVR